MSLDAKQVRGVASLARLRIAEDELESYAGELSAILDFVDQLSSADTADVTPMAHPLSMHQRLRADEVSEPDCRERMMDNAPESADGVFLVPRVIE